jgi:hypothetical protein
MISEPGGIYRKHAGQTTSQPQYAEIADQEQLRVIVRAQAEALRASGWRWP